MINIKSYWVGMCIDAFKSGADPGFLKGGGDGVHEKWKRVHPRSPSKKGRSRRGSNFGPNVKKPIQWAKKGGPDPLDDPAPPDPPMHVILLVIVFRKRTFAIPGWSMDVSKVQKHRWGPHRSMFTSVYRGFGCYLLVTIHYVQRIRYSVVCRSFIRY